MWQTENKPEITDQLRDGDWGWGFLSAAAKSGQWQTPACWKKFRLRRGGFKKCKHTNSCGVYMLTLAFWLSPGASRAPQRLRQLPNHREALQAKTAPEHWTQHDRHRQRPAEEPGWVRPTLHFSVSHESQCGCLASNRVPLVVNELSFHSCF